VRSRLACRASTGLALSAPELKPFGNESRYVACLRIGHCAVEPINDRPAHAAWLSPGDAARLVDACLRSSVLTYAIVWGVSANTGRWWSLDEAERSQKDSAEKPSPPPQSLNV
jgi:hypothetical protein